MSLTKPTQIAVPFAASGSKTAIPPTADNVTGRAGYDAGFPAITRTAKAAGGIPPFGTDFNGIFYDAFSAIQYLEAGGAFPYDSTFATAIGGYPVGALVSRADGMGLWKNLVAGNTTNPDNLGAGWDTLNSGITSITMTNANVTLTAAQAARDIIVITGVLKSNLNLIFPIFNKSWTIINNTTGAFTVTCKTTSGTGISFSSGDSISISCDSVNIITSTGNSLSALRVGTASAPQHAATKLQVDSVRSLLYVEASLVGGSMTLTLPKQSLKFRNPTLTAGAPVEIVLTNDLTLTIPSGATLGTTSGILSNLIPVVLYNGGSPVLGISNQAGGVDLSESGLLSTTAISAGALSANIVYSPVSLSSSPFIVAGVVQSTQSSAGVWDTQPNINSAQSVGGVMFDKRLISQSFPTTSGTAISVTGIPAWAKRITIVFDDVSCASITSLLVQVGNASLITSGYTAGSVGISTSSANLTLGGENTTGFNVRYSTAADAIHGEMVLNVSQSSVVSRHVTHVASSQGCYEGAGKLALSGGVTQLTLTTIAGNVAFDGGSFYLIYEG